MRKLIKKILRESDDLEWTEEIVNQPISIWGVLRDKLLTIDEINQNYNLDLIIKDIDYLRCSLVECDSGILDTDIRKVTVLKYSNSSNVRDTDCGCGDRDDEEESVSLWLGFTTRKGIYISFWFLPDWIDITLTPKEIK